jgi:hypothetical protein
LRAEDFGTINPAMQQTSLLFPHKASHPLAAKTLTIVLSIGAHYLIASNLGIFGSFTPLKLKPGGGTVKVVSLTPAERARVPEAVRSSPAPIAQNPINPDPATRSFSDFSNIPKTDRGNSTPSTPPVNVPSPSSSSSQPKTSPSSSATPKPSKPKGPTLGFDRNNKFELADRNPTTPSGETGSRKKPGRSNQSTDTNRSTDTDTKKDELERRRRADVEKNQRLEDEKRKREEEERERREAEKNKKNNSQSAVTRRFDQEVVGDLRRKYPGIQPERVSAENPSPYQLRVSGCDKSQDTYITVGVFYPVFKFESPYDEPPLPMPYYRVSGNAKDPKFVKEIQRIAYEELVVNSGRRLDQIPIATRHSVEKFFHTDFVYPSKSCSN